MLCFSCVCVSIDAITVHTHYIHFYVLLQFTHYWQLKNETTATSNLNFIGLRCPFSECKANQNEYFFKLLRDYKLL